MPDQKRLREQLYEMTLRTEARAAVTEDCAKVVSEQKKIVERDLQKLKFLIESFQKSEEYLAQKKAELAHSGQDLGGVEDALVNIKDLILQARQRIPHQNGALAALNAVEKTFSERSQEAKARIRGLEMQAKRVLKSETPPKKTEDTSSEDTETAKPVDSVPL